jgi:phage/plasmid-associated DNA primase
VKKPWEMTERELDQWERELDALEAFNGDLIDPGTEKWEPTRMSPANLAMVMAYQSELEASGRADPKYGMPVVRKAFSELVKGGTLTREKRSEWLRYMPELADVLGGADD